MKLNALAVGLVSELIRSEKEIDQFAETIDEICAAVGIKRSTANVALAAKVKAGLAEQVWKVANGRTVKAYRLKRHETQKQKSR